MRTIGLIRAASDAQRRDLWPRLRAEIATADEQVSLELPAFTWRWRIVSAGAISVPFLVPNPVHFLAACGLL